MKKYQLSRQRPGLIWALSGFTLAIWIVLAMVAWHGMPMSAAAEQITLAPSPAPTATPAPSDPPPGGETGSPLVIEDPPLDEVDALEAEVIDSPPGREIYIIFHQDHLNREVAAFIQTEPEFPFHDVVIAFHPGEMKVTAQTEVVGLSVGVEVWLKVTAVDCKPAVEVTSLAVGGLWTPQFIKDQIAGYIYESLEKYPDDYPICWTKIEVKEGELALKGVKR